MSNKAPKIVIVSFEGETLIESTQIDITAPSDIERGLLRFVENGATSVVIIRNGRGRWDVSFDSNISINKISRISGNIFKSID